jgi:hypothetical protein
MSREKLKVLEMVAEGKISAEEGVRLIEAMGQADRQARRGARHGVEIPDIRIPRIDLGNMGEMVVELKKNVERGARKASDRIRETSAGKYFTYKDYPVSVGWPDGVNRCILNLECSAGKLKLKGADITGKILLGKVKRSPEEPQVSGETEGENCTVRLRQVVGRGLLRFNQHMPCTITLNNSASDARLNLEKIKAEHIELSNSAGNAIIKLGNRVPRVSLAVDNNAGNLKLIVPDEYAVRIKQDKNMSADNLGRFDLSREDGALVSADWGENERQVELVLSQNVANLSLDWRRPKKKSAVAGEVEEPEVPDVDDFDLDDDEDEE